GSPVSVAVAPDGKTAYVVDDSAATVVPIDTATDTLGEPIPVGGPSTGAVNSIAILPNQPPRAALAGPRVAYTGLPVSLDASGSSDDEGIRSYRFEPGDGEVVETAEPEVSHTYSTPGTYQARVTVDDGEGCEPLADRFPGLPSPFTGRTAHCNGPSVVTSKPLKVEVRKLRPLRLKLGLKRKLRSLRRVPVTVKCAAIECEARASGTLRLVEKKKTKKARSFKLRAARLSLRAN